MSNVKTTKAGKYFEGIGRRKTSSARVRLTPSAKNSFNINGRDLKSYFATDEQRLIAEEPFKKLKAGHFSVSVKVSGGGIHSQAEAVRHGIARALLKHDANLRGELKKHKMLTRDGRAKERRKFGLKKARKAPQWSKR